MKRFTHGTAVLALATSAGLAAAQGSNICSDAQQIAGYGLFEFQTSGATTDGLTGCSQAFNDVWFAWTPSDGEAGVVCVSTCGGTDLNTVVMVYSEPSRCGGPGTLLGCNNDFCGTQSQVSFFAMPGESYLIRIGASQSDLWGSGIFTIRSGRIGSVVNPANGNLYQLFEPMSWSVTEQTAQALRGHIASISDADENEWVRANLANFGDEPRHVWLGFNDRDSEGDFVWSSGEPVTFVNWESGQPDNLFFIEHYAEMSPASGLWNDQANIPSDILVYGLIEIPRGGCPADFNGDTQIDFFDYLDFAQAFETGDPLSDFNGDNQTDFFDYLDFVLAFDAGCD